MTLGEKIRQQREAKGMTQLELAQKIGYTTTGAVSLIESGKRDISIDKVREIAKALDVTPHWLMGWSPVICFIRNQYKIGISEASIKISWDFRGTFNRKLLFFCTKKRDSSEELPHTKEKRKMKKPN